jgi:predicted NUDIX family phosphoesterase
MRLFALVVGTILNRINEGLMAALFSSFMVRARGEAEYNNTIKQLIGPAFVETN